MSVTHRWLALSLLAIVIGCDTGDDSSDVSPNTPDSDVFVDQGIGSDGNDMDLVASLDATVTPDLGPVDMNEVSPLIADAGSAQSTFVGVEITLDGSASLGAVTYQWDFGNGDAQPDPVEEPQARAVYQTPGRYRATLTIADAQGSTHRDQVVITVTERPTHTPRHSDTITRLSPFAWGAEELGTDRFAVVVTDDNAVAIIGQGESGFARIARLSTAPDPRTLVAWIMSPERPQTSARLAVVCQRSGVMQIFNQLDGSLAAEVTFPPASRPYGVTTSADGQRLFVTLQGSGQVAELLGGVDDTWRINRLVDIGPDARGIALLPDGRLAITRWRSPDTHGELWIWDPDDEAPAVIWPLAYDPQAASDTEIGGVPNYLDHILISPQGHELALPSTQAHFAHGELTSGSAAAFDEVLRAVVSFVDIEAEGEVFERRKQFDGRGLASAGVYTRYGDYLYLAMRGSRTVERLDRFSANQSGTLVNTGRAVEGLALSRDDRLLFVNATLDRVIKIYDVSSFTTLPMPVAEIALVDQEPLDSQILTGKQLFNDSADPRLSQEGYIACAHCHLEGDSDHRTWDFSDRGEGLRQTISLLGRQGSGHGPIHWSANFDEGQDFESDLRGPFGGFGLMTDEDFHTGTRAMSLGDPKRGLSPELDALAAYMTSLNTHLPSPHRDPSGALTDEAQLGRALFFSEEVGCSECHAPPRMTDSQFLDDGEPLLHDVGTLSDLSGLRLHGPLIGLDTPTLHGLWHSAPYLHDGSAASLRDVLTTANLGDAHGRTSGLSEEELSHLEAYLLSLDGRWE